MLILYFSFIASHNITTPVIRIFDFCFAANVLTRFPLVESEPIGAQQTLVLVSTPRCDPRNRADILFCPAQMWAPKLYYKQMDVPWAL